MPISPDAILAGAITVGLFALLAMWKLATMLANQNAVLAQQKAALDSQAGMVREIRGQVRHNGGSSLKDDARTAAQEAGKAREEAVKARELAAKVATDLVEFRGYQADAADAQRTAIAAVQHDVTNVRAGQTLLLDRQDKVEERLTTHGERNKQQIAVLQDAVDAAAERDAALRAALHESLDLAIAVQEASGEVTG